jgi:hypothetical protein
MNELQATIERLSSAFADDLLRTLRQLPLEEMIRLVGGQPSQRKAVVPSSAPKQGAPRASAPSRPSNAESEQALYRFFEASGQRGATAQQAYRHLQENGDREVAIGTTSKLIDSLVSRGVLRDAGFRRTTGNGTAPVFVFTPL